MQLYWSTGVNCVPKFSFRNIHGSVRIRCDKQKLCCIQKLLLFSLSPLRSLLAFFPFPCRLSVPLSGPCTCKLHAVLKEILWHIRTIAKRTTARHKRKIITNPRTNLSCLAQTQTLLSIETRTRPSLDTSSTPDGLVRCHSRPLLAAWQAPCEA